MSAKSKKGSKFERDVCQLLSAWFSGGDVEADWFWRTAGSGGRATNRRKKGKSADRMSGDVCAIDPAGEPLMKVFACELKRGYSKDTIQDLIDAPETAAAQTYAKWLEQAQASRDNAGVPYWMIICKRDKREPLVMLPPAFVLELGFVGRSWRGAGCKLKLESEEYGGVLVATLSDFLENVSPEAIHVLAERKDAAGKITPEELPGT